MKIGVKKVLKTVRELAICAIPALFVTQIEAKIFDWSYDWLPVRLASSLEPLYFVVACICAYRLVITWMVLESIHESFKKPLITPEREPIAADHGYRLAEVMEAIRREKYEYKSYFDLAGNKIAEGTCLSPNCTRISDESWRGILSKGETVIGLHNHPGCLNMAFSDADFESFLTNDLVQKSIVVTPHYNYFLERVEAGYEYVPGDATICMRKLDMENVWICLFSVRLWSTVVARKTAECFGLRFSSERAHRMSIKRHTMRQSCN